MFGCPRLPGFFVLGCPFGHRWTRHHRLGAPARDALNDEKPPHLMQLCQVATTFVLVDT
jgi:hypothetical protein